MNLIMATNNAHKIEEIRSILAPHRRVRLHTLREAGIDQEIPEPFDSLEENAQTKARTVHRLSAGKDCFSEDTGLEVDFLHGKPGVHSARYSGEPPSSARNIDKLLISLADTTRRRARFRTIICLILGQTEILFEGICEGKILFQRQGEDGFGYDPIFAPGGGDRSFAEMTAEEKNQISHRRQAINKMIGFLRKQNFV